MHVGRNCKFRNNLGNRVPRTHLKNQDAGKPSPTADEAYDVTPLLPPFVDLLNQVAAAGYAPWQAGQTQSVLRKAFAPFGLAEGQLFMEYDLIHLDGDYLFWGARNIDGRGFDSEANRPTNLQIPLRRVR